MTLEFNEPQLIKTPWCIYRADGTEIPEDLIAGYEPTPRWTYAERYSRENDDGPTEYIAVRCDLYAEGMTVKSTNSEEQRKMLNVNADKKT